MSSPNLNTFDIYNDATQKTENKRKSIQGYEVVYNDGEVSQISQLQNSTALSSVEAEIIAANEEAKERTWIDNFWKDVQQKRYVPTLWCDSEAVKEICKSSRKFHNKGKHIETRYFYVRNDMVTMNRLYMDKIAGTENSAGIHMKQLIFNPLMAHTKALGIGEFNKL